MQHGLLKLSRPFHHRPTVYIRLFFINVVILSSLNEHEGFFEHSLMKITDIVKYTQHILLLLIEDLFGSLHVKPPMILGEHSKNIEKFS